MSQSISSGYGPILASSTHSNCVQSSNCLIVRIISSAMWMTWHGMSMYPQNRWDSIEIFFLVFVCGMQGRRKRSCCACCFFLPWIDWFLLHLCAVTPISHSSLLSLSLSFLLSSFIMFSNHLFEKCTCWHEEHVFSKLCIYSLFDVFFSFFFIELF